jgi:hypothetical protein
VSRSGLIVKISASVQKFNFNALFGKQEAEDQTRGPSAYNNHL